MLRIITPFYYRNSNNLLSNSYKAKFAMPKILWSSYIIFVGTLSYMQIKNPPQVDWCQPAYISAYKRGF
jgi:hypothetical protein